jgi:hypothetical protein
MAATLDSDKERIRNIKISIDALTRAMKPLAFNYRLYEKWQVESAHGHWQLYRKYQSAKEYWERIINERTK